MINLNMNLNSVFALGAALILATTLGCTKPNPETTQPQNESFPAVDNTPTSSDPVVTSEGIAAPNGTPVADPQTTTGQHSDCAPNDAECLKVKGSSEQVKESKK